MSDIVVFAPHPTEGAPWDVAIIGSGPASLTAAIYTTRGALSTLILGGEAWGGQLMFTTTVDNYPGFPKGIEGPILMNQMREQAERFGSKFVEQNVTSVDFASTPFLLTAGGTTYKANSVIVATGAQTQWLGVPGEKKLIGRGVSSCAPCDAPFFKDKKVLVVGGGDSAMEEALVLTKYASQVIVVHRRNEFRASAAMQQKVLNHPLIRVIWNTEVVETLGDMKLTSVSLKTKKDSSENNLTSEKIKQEYSGTIVGEEAEEIIWQMPTDGIFVAIGHCPSTTIFEGQLELDELGYIKKLPNETYQMATSKEGIFVSGDVHDTRYKQAISAAGFGCMAAMEVLKFNDKNVPSW